MEEGRSGIGGAGDYHDFDAISHAPEPIQDQNTETVIFLSDFDDLNALNQQEV